MKYLFITTYHTYLFTNRQTKDNTLYCLRHKHGEELKDDAPQSQ